METFNRIGQIQKILEEKGHVTVKELSKMIFASPATIRRDLTQMENDGIVKRYHGGVKLSTFLDYESSYVAREQFMRQQKVAIAKRVAESIRGDSVIFLDSSSTVINILPYLTSKSNLVIVTNGLRIALESSKLKNAEIHVIGGKLAPFSNGLVGERTLLDLSKLNFDYALLSTSGFDDKGKFYDSISEQCEIKRMVASHSKKVFILADSSKFGKVFLHTTFSAKDIDALFTDESFKDEEIKNFTDNDCKFITCN